MASYLYAVQDAEGREIVSAHVDVEKVTDIKAAREEGQVRLHFEYIDVVDPAADPGGELSLCRWPSDDKLADPVKHPVS